MGEQVSGTFRLWDPAPGKGEYGFWEAPGATAQRSSPRLVLRPSPVLQRRLLRSVHTTAIIPSAPFVFPTANAQYVRCYLVQCLIMFLLHLVTSMIVLFILVLVKFMTYLFRNFIG